MERYVCPSCGKVVIGKDIPEVDGITQFERNGLHGSRKRNIIKLLSSKGARETLEFLNQHGKAQFTDMKACIPAPSLSNRLRELLAAKLINHHFTRMEKRREWYEITERGRKILQLLEEIERTAPF